MIERPVIEAVGKRSSPPKDPQRCPDCGELPPYHASNCLQNK